jgi:hypothetical protein
LPEVEVSSKTLKTMTTKIKDALCTCRSEEIKVTAKIEFAKIKKLEVVNIEDLYNALVWK